MMYVNTGNEVADLQYPRKLVNSYSWPLRTFCLVLFFFSTVIVKERIYLCSKKTSFGHKNHKVVKKRKTVEGQEDSMAFFTQPFWLTRIARPKVFAHTNLLKNIY